MSLLFGISADMLARGAGLFWHASAQLLDVMWYGLFTYGVYGAIGGLMAAFVVMAVRLHGGRTIDQASHPILSRFVRHPDWLTARESAVFVGLSVLFGIGFPGSFVLVLNPPDGFSFLFNYPVAIVHGVVLGLVLALVGIGTVGIKLVTPWEEDILGFTAQYVAVGLLVGIWISLWPILWEPVIRWIIAG